MFGCASRRSWPRRRRSKPRYRRRDIRNWRASGGFGGPRRPHRPAKNLTRRANHRHIFIIARIEPAPGSRSRAFSNDDILLSASGRVWYFEVFSKSDGEMAEFGRPGTCELSSIGLFKDRPSDRFPASGPLLSVAAIAASLPA